MTGTHPHHRHPSEREFLGFHLTNGRVGTKRRDHFDCELQRSVCHEVVKRFDQERLKNGRMSMEFLRQPMKRMYSGVPTGSSLPNALGRVLAGCCDALQCGYAHFGGGSRV